MFGVWRDREVSALTCWGERLASDACVATHAPQAWSGLPEDPGPMAGKASGPLTRLME